MWRGVQRAGGMGEGRVIVGREWDEKGLGGTREQRNWNQELSSMGHEDAEAEKSSGNIRSAKSG